MAKSSRENANTAPPSATHIPIHPPAHPPQSRTVSHCGDCLAAVTRPSLRRHFVSLVRQNTRRPLCKSVFYNARNGRGGDVFFMAIVVPGTGASAQCLRERTLVGSALSSGRQVTRFSPVNQRGVTGDQSYVIIVVVAPSSIGTSGY